MTSEWAEDVALEPVTELEIAPNPINNTALVILPTVEQPEVARISVFTSLVILLCRSSKCEQ